MTLIAGAARYKEEFYLQTTAHIMYCSSIESISVFTVSLPAKSTENSVNFEKFQELFHAWFECNKLGFIQLSCSFSQDLEIKEPNLNFVEIECSIVKDT